MSNNPTPSLYSLIEAKMENFMSNYPNMTLDQIHKLFDDWKNYNPNGYNNFRTYTNNQMTSNPEISDSNATIIFNNLINWLRTNAPELIPGASPFPLGKSLQHVIRDKLMDYFSSHYPNMTMDQVMQLWQDWPITNPTKSNEFNTYFSDQLTNNPELSESNANYIFNNLISWFSLNAPELLSAEGSPTPILNTPTPNTPTPNTPTPNTSTIRSPNNLGSGESPIKVQGGSKKRKRATKKSKKLSKKQIIRKRKMKTQKK